MTRYLYVNATVDDLRLPELIEKSFRAVTEAMLEAGLARLEHGNTYGRWERVTD